MRRADVLGAIVVTALLAFALAACLCPQIFAGRRGPMELAVGVLATVFAAKLTIPVSLFGRAEALTAPLVLAFAAPCFLGLVGLDAGMRRLEVLRAARRPAPARPAAGYYLPARVATALAAAARARR